MAEKQCEVCYIVITCNYNVIQLDVLTFIWKMSDVQKPVMWTNNAKKRERKNNADTQIEPKITVGNNEWLAFLKGNE